MTRLTLAFILFMLLTPLAFAQTGTSTAAKKLPPGFEPVAGAPDVEKINPSPLVVGAYAMFFVTMFGYMIWVSRSQTAMSQEMAELAERIKRAEKK
jgi:hypothetical protein